MLISALLGPGTIFLMTVGAISISFDLDIFASFIVIVTPVVVFAVICLTCRQETQVGLQLQDTIGALLVTIFSVNCITKTVVFCGVNLGFFSRRFSSQRITNLS